MSMARKKVLFMIPSLDGGGAERVFSNLLRTLDRGMFEVHLAVLTSVGRFMADVPADVSIHDLKISRIRYAMPGIVRLLWKLKPDAVLATLGPLNLTLASCRFLMPRNTRLLIRQNWTAGARMEHMEHPERWNWAYRWLYRKVDKIVCQSDVMVAEMVKHFRVPREKLIRIYNPVDLQRVWELSQAGDNPFHGPGPHMVTAGRLSLEKGYDVLLDAMPKVLQALPGTRLYILGDGPRLNELTSQSARLGLVDRVQFLGFQDNPWRYFRHADLFVLSSRNDALPNALLEALVLGTPVIATDCPGSIREIMDCDTERVMLVPPENASELAKGMIRATQSLPRSRYGLAEAEERLRRFDLRQIVEQYNQVLLAESNLQTELQEH